MSKSTCRLFRYGPLALALLAVPTPAAQADETTFCNTFITAVPFTISAQGHYCFNKNLSTSITTGAAITINADFVVLDLNNFKLGGGGAGLGTQTIGVKAVNRSNLTVRGGNIRGFFTGISLTGSPSNNHVVENNALDGNTKFGIEVDGGGIVVRNNIISNTGGSTVVTDTVRGIFTSGGATVLNNVVSTMLYASLYVDAIDLYDGGVGAGNILKLDYTVYDTTLVYGVYGGAICRDNSVVNADFAIQCDAYVNNLEVIAP